MQIVVFRLNKNEYALNITHVQEIVRVSPITKLPNSLDHMEGVVNLRGVIVPVISLAKKFGWDSIEDNVNNRFIVVQLSDKNSFAIRAEQVNEVLHIDESSIDDTTENKGIDFDEMVHGIIKQPERLITLLNPVNLL